MTHSVRWLPSAPRRAPQFAPSHLGQAAYSRVRRLGQTPARVLSLPELQGLAIAHNFPDPVTAAAIAEAESGGKTWVEGDVTIGGSIGLWQIYTKAHPQYDRLKLTDPDYNAQAAFEISGGGRNWMPWSTYHTVPDPTVPQGSPNWGLREVGAGNGSFKKYYRPDLTPVPWTSQAQTQTTPPPQCDPCLTPNACNTISINSSDRQAVVEWQLVLIRDAAISGATFKIADGNFGSATDLATKSWQRAKGIVPDGVVGPATWRAACSVAVAGVTDEARCLNQGGIWVVGQGCTLPTPQLASSGGGSDNSGLVIAGLVIAAIAAAAAVSSS